MRTHAHPVRELVGPARARLFEALRSAPDGGAHVRELARGAGLSLSSLQRELARLTAMGMVKSSRRGNRVLHGLRRTEPLVRLLFAAVTALELKDRRLSAMPADRAAEGALARLCAHLPPDPALWRQFGEHEFLAGLAVMLAGHRGFDRASYLALAESLAPGSGTLERFQAWHRANRPNLPRFFSMVDRERRSHARSAV